MFENASTGTQHNNILNDRSNNKTMKRLPLFLSFLSVIGFLHGQPQLSILNTPQSGNTYIFSPCGYLISSPGNGGSNMIWDFSELSVSDDTIATFYTNDTAYNAFPDYDYPSFYFDTSKYNLKSYHYLYKITDERYSIAYQIVPVTAYTPQACPVDITLFNMPFSYEDEVSETWSCGAINAGIRNIQADGYGTLILPDSTYFNALRLRTTEKQEFEPSSPNPSAHYDTTWTDLYKWFTESSEVPVYSIRYYTKHSWSMGSFYLSQDTTVQMLKEVLLTTLIKEKKENEFRLSLSPNPAREIITMECLSSERGPVTFELMDLQGRMIEVLGSYEIHQEKTSFTFSLQGMTSGIYLIVAKTRRNTILQKLVVL